MMPSRSRNAFPLRAALIVVLASLASPATAGAAIDVVGCLGDFTGATGDEPDGVVGIADLLLLLSTWGETGPPRPRTDIAPVSGVDNVVDIRDLLEILARWGQCTPSFRLCEEAIHPAATDARITADGAYEFFIDGFLDGPQRGPTNDVALILAGPTTCGWANYGGGIPGGFLYGDIFGINMFTDPFTEGGDVWFHYTASCNGSAFFETLSNCGEGELIDTLVEVYPGDACPTDWTDLLACDDDWTAPESCSDYFSRARLNTLLGEEYLVRVGGYIAEQGSGTLEVSCIDNSIFENALPLELNESFLGSTVNAQVPTAPECGGVAVEVPGHWFTIVGTGAVFEASTCGSDLTFDTRLSVYCSTDGTEAGLTCIVAAQDDACDLDETVTWCTEAGRTYYILVHGTPGLLPPFTTEGDYMLEVSSDGQACGDPNGCVNPVLSSSAPRKRHGADSSCRGRFREHAGYAPGPPRLLPFNCPQGDWS